MTNADRQTGQHPSGSRDDMLKHLWRSLTEFRRRPCSLDAARDRLIEAQQAYELQIAQYKVQLNAFQLQQRDAEKSRQSTDALKAMVVTLQQMLDNLHAPGVAR